MVGTLVAGLLFSLAVVVRAQASLASAGGEYHPLVFTNPFYALYVVLSDPTGTPMHVGRLFQLLFFASSSPTTIGPAIEPWQAVVLIQAVLVALSVVGAVHLVQSRRAPMPWRPPLAPELAGPEGAGESGEFEDDPPTPTLPRGGTGLKEAGP
jgi:hypothetical protein